MPSQIQNGRNIAVIIAVVLLLIGLGTSASAQTVIAVPFDTATFQWTVPAPDATHSAATSHLLTCGTASLSVAMPSNTALVKDVVVGPGTYTCTVKAVNAFGSTAEVAFPQFQAGYLPLAPTNTQIVVP